MSSPISKAVSGSGILEYSVFGHRGRRSFRKVSEKLLVEGGVRRFRSPHVLVRRGEDAVVLRFRADDDRNRYPAQHDLSHAGRSPGEVYEQPASLGQTGADVVRVVDRKHEQPSGWLVSRQPPHE